MESNGIQTVENPDSQTPSPWGAWATIGWSLLIGLVFLAGNVFTGLLFLGVRIVRNPQTEMEPFIRSLETDGFFLAITTCFAGSVGVGCLVMLAKLRKRIAIQEYFAFHAIPGRDMLKWVGLLLGFVVLSDSLTLLLGRPIVPEFMTDVYSSARYPFLLWLALIVWAPLFEEMFFRGFTFAGLLNSKLGPTGTVLFTAATWSVIHMQYDLYGIFSIFLGGLLLGYARWKSGSIYPCLTLHASMNLIATLETVFVLSIGDGPSK